MFTSRSEPQFFCLTRAFFEKGWRHVVNADASRGVATVRGWGVSQALPDRLITATMMERMSEGSVREPRAHAETFRTDRAG